MYSKNQIIAEAFRSIREFLNIQQNHIDQVEKQTTQLEQKLKHFETHRIEQFQQQQKQLDFIESYLRSLEQPQFDPKTIEQINQTLQQQQNALNHLEKQTLDLEQQMHFYTFEKITSDLKQQQAQIEALKQRIENLELENEKIQTKTTQDLIFRITDLENHLTPLQFLEKNLNSEDFWLQKIAQILPSAILLEQQTELKEMELTHSLQSPVENCIRQSINQDTRPFASALFPVMGPAIRKSINESLKMLIQSINQTMERSLSLQGLFWRWQAFRSGRPFSEIVLQHTIIYRIEEVFLIHRETGLLIQHLHQPEVEIRDREAVSAMLTAIQDFIRDSFSTQEEELDSVEIGEYTVWLERGPYAVLACVIRGFAPFQFRNIMRSILEKMHKNYGALLQQFSGDNAPFQPCLPLLEQALLSETKSQTKKSVFSPQLIIILTLFSLVLLSWGYWHFQYEQRLARYIQALKETPGIVVISTQKQEGRQVIYGMHDPLAQSPQQMAQQFDLTDKEIKGVWTLYQDLSEPFAEQRLKQQFYLPNTVQLSLRDGVVHLTGHADPEWIKQMAKIQLIAGLYPVKTDELVETDQFLLVQAQQIFTAFDQITLSVKERILHLSGLIDASTFQQIQKLIEKLPLSSEAFAQIDTSHLVDIEKEKTRFIARIEKTKFYFSEKAELIAGQEDRLQTLLKTVQQLFSLNPLLAQPVYLQIIGDTDGRGSKNHNRQLAQQRAQVILNWLQQQGVETQYLTITLPAQFRFGENKPNQRLRNVSFQVKSDEE